MKYLAVFGLFLCFLTSTQAQSTRLTSRPRPRSTPIKAPPRPPTELESFTSASSIAEPEGRIAALKAFLNEFPDTEKRVAAQELLAAALSESANLKMQTGDIQGGVEHFREAAEIAPSPISEKLFTETISKIAPSLYFHGEQAEALEIARVLEPKIQTNLTQLLSLGDFYVSSENGASAKRMAERAVELAPDSLAAFLMLATAHRLQFELEQSAVAYSKALDLDPASLQARRGLADMYRALGRFTDAAAKYKEILAKDESNIPARTGLILAMFDSGERTAAEKEMDAALQSNPNNVILLAGAAYWYAIHSQSERAVDLAQKAIAAEPRYVWSHLALARAYLDQKKPADAEQALLRGRQYGRFPTLEYELALSRASAGLYREAVESLRGSFSLDGDKVKVQLGGRVERSDQSFADLLAPERKASIFEPDSVADVELAAKLKSLLAFDREINAVAINEEALSSAADEFIAGDDAMKVHRQIYVASTMLEKRVALAKVIELTKSAVAFTDPGLSTPNAGAAIMASELYESRMTAVAKNEYLRVPDVPKPTLLAILRGRIEEIAGWAFYQEGKTADAVIRLRRAVSVLPDKSAWWRSSTWKLGAALQADGKDSEALDSYIKSYKSDKPDAARYIVVEALYKKVRGSSEGLEAEIGANPMPVIAAQPIEPVTVPVPIPSAEPGTVPVPTSSRQAEVAAPPTPEPAPTAVSKPVRTETEAIPREVPVAPAKVEQQIEPEPVSGDSGVPVTESSPSPKAESTPAEPREKVAFTSEQLIKPLKTESPSPSPTPQATPAPIVDIAPQITPVPTPLPTPEPSPSPAADLSMATPSPTPAVEESPVVLPSPSPAEVSPGAKKTEPPGLVLDMIKQAPPLEEAKKLETSTQEPPGGKIELEPTSKPSSLAVVVTENIPPPVTIRPPAKVQPQSPTAQKKSSSINTGSLFEPVIITVPSHTTAAGDPISPAPRICSVSVSQERISLAGAGGSIGLLVGTGDPTDLKALKYYSSSPKDIIVRPEARIAGADDKAFFVIRSLSRNTGVYQVVFEAPCGKKQVIVNVR